MGLYAIAETKKVPTFNCIPITLIRYIGLKIYSSNSDLSLILQHRNLLCVYGSKLFPGG